jgi:acetolactate synthase-1/2/3 large subunit
MKNGLKIKKSIDGQIKNLIKESKRPILILGGGSRGVNCLNEIYKLKNNLKIPILLTHHTLDILDHDDPNNMGFPGIFGIRYSNMIIQTSDLIIALGTRLGLAQTGYNKDDFGRNAKKIIVDIDPTELQKDNISNYLPVNMSAEKFLKFLNSESDLFRNLDSNWMKRANQVKHKFNLLNEKHVYNDQFVNSYKFIDWLSTNLKTQVNYCTDMGISYQSTYQAIKLTNRSRLITNTNFAPMGWGISAAIGICLGSGNRNTYLLTGDGGLMMNLQELATIAFHNLPIKIIVYSNGGYLTMKQSQALGFNGRFTGVDLKSGICFPDWKSIAKSFNLEFYQIEKDAELDNSLLRILENQSPALIKLNMSIDQTQIPRAIPKQYTNSTFSQTLLENPFPELEDDELAANIQFLIGELS